MSEVKDEAKPGELRTGQEEYELDAWFQGHAVGDQKVRGGKARRGQGHGSPSKMAPSTVEAMRLALGLQPSTAAMRTPIRPGRPGLQLKSHILRLNADDTSLLPFTKPHTVLGSRSTQIRFLRTRNGAGISILNKRHCTTVDASNEARYGNELSVLQVTSTSEVYEGGSPKGKGFRIRDAMLG